MKWNMKTWWKVYNSWKVKIQFDGVLWIPWRIISNVFVQFFLLWHFKRAFRIPIPWLKNQGSRSLWLRWLRFLLPSSVTSLWRKECRQKKGHENFWCINIHWFICEGWEREGNVFTTSFSFTNFEIMRYEDVCSFYPAFYCQPKHSKTSSDSLRHMFSLFDLPKEIESPPRLPEKVGTAIC